MPLSLEAQEALDRSLAALDSQSAQLPNPDTRAGEAHSLVWTGAGYVRRPLGPGEGDDAIRPAPPAEVEAGWSIVHAACLDTDASGGDVVCGRSGVVYDVTPAGHDAETGETLPVRLHAAAMPIGDGSRQRGPVQLDAAWPDEVESAQPVAWPSLRELLASSYRELALLARRRRLDSAGELRRDWLMGVVAVLDNVRRTRGWK